MRKYWREFTGGMSEALGELRADRNWLGYGLLVICTPLLFVATILAFLGDIGPE